MSALLPAAVLAAPVRVGVVHAGPDPASGGALAAAIEARLRVASGLEVARAEDLAKNLAGAQPAELDRARHPAAAIVRRAEEAYFAARIDEVDPILKEADAALAAGAGGSTERVRVLLLRTALHSSSGDAVAARASARAALALDPALSVAPYPPSVQALVEEVRLTLPRRAVLRVFASPSGAAVTIDDRAAPGGVLAVLPGEHVVSVHARGFRTVSRTVRIEIDTTLRVTLPAALPPEADRTLAEWVREAKGPPPAELASLAASASLDRLIVIGSTGNEVRAAVFETSGDPGPSFGGPFPITAGGSPELSKWVAMKSTTAASGDASRSNGRIATGASLLAFGAGAGFYGAQMMTARSIAVKNRDAAPGGDSRALYQKDVDRFTTRGAAGLGVSAVAAGAGLWLLWSSRGDGDGSRSAATVVVAPGEAHLNFVMEIR